MEYNGTRIINAYERYDLEVPDVSYPLEKSYQVIWKTRHKENPLQEKALF